MVARHFLKPLAAIPLFVLLSGCALTTPGMVGTPDGGVVQPFPWRNKNAAAALHLAQRYCRQYQKRAYLVQWTPGQGNSKFNCVY